MTCRNILWAFGVLSVLAVAYGQEEGELTYGYVSEATNISKLEGESALFKCEVQGLESFQRVIWMIGSGVISFNREKLTQDPRLRLKGKNNRYNLEVQDITMDDEDSYTCQITGEPQLFQTNYLIVQIPPTVEIMPDDPLIEQTLGGSITLNCKAEGKPQPTVTWKREGGKLPWGAETHEGEILELTNLGRGDGGKYTCTADNGAGNPVTEMIEIEMTYPPSVRVEQEVVHTGPGADVSIQCSFQASPLSDVIWKHNQSHIDWALRPHIIAAREEYPENTWAHILRFEKLAPEDLGVYRCEGRNVFGDTAGQITLTALPTPVQLSEECEAYSDQYKLIFTVTSGPPLIDCDISIMITKEMNGTWDSQWQNQSIPIIPTSLGIYTVEETLEGLDPETEYPFKVQCRNSFGTTPWVIRSFETLKEGIKPPTPGVVEPKPGKSVEEGREGFVTVHVTVGTDEPANSGNSLYGCSLVMVCLVLLRRFF